MQHTDPWAKAGVMCRETLEDGSRHVFMVISSANGTGFQRRVVTGSISEHTAGPAVSTPYWVRLVRRGNTFTGQVSSGGSTWTYVGSATINMSNRLYAGLAVTAHNNGALNTSTFDNVEVVTASNQPPEVAVTSPTNSAVFAQGANIPLSATAIDSYHLVTNVSFLREIFKIGEAASPPFNSVWNSAPAGQFAIRAEATDDFGASTLSDPVYVRIVPPSGSNAFSVKINFQTNTSPEVSGYLPDFGYLFGDRGNGFSYGWNADNTAFSRYRNSANSYDLRYDTLNHMQKTGGAVSWEIAVPNGDYQVRVVSGDPTATDSRFQVNVEGVLTVSGIPTPAQPWVEGFSIVTVNDGRLTVSNGQGASNNKICFIEITSVAPPQPPALLSPELLADGTLQFLVRSDGSATYVIEASTNLSTWVPVFTNSITTNLFRFSDPGGARNHGSHFYRALQP